MKSPSASPFTPPLPQGPGQRLRWSGLHGAAEALGLASAGRQYPGLVLLITGNSQEAQRLEREIRFFSADEFPILSLPDWETLPYDVFSPHQDIVSQRLTTLYRLPEAHRGMLVVPIGTLMQRLPPTDYVRGHTFLLAVGDAFDIQRTRDHLDKAGYRCVSEVVEHGEFAVRGSLLDVFPMGAVWPYRIDLLDDEIDSIRTFDPDSQRSRDKVERINVLPAREFPSGDDGIKRFRQAYRAEFEGDPQRGMIYRDVSAGHFPGGIEYYLPLFFDSTAALFDYLPADTLAIQTADCAGATETFWRQLQERYEQLRHDLTRPLLPPSELYLTPEQIRQRLAPARQIQLLAADDDRQTTPGRHLVPFDVGRLPELRFETRSEHPARRLTAFIADFPGRTLLLAETPGRREALRETLTRAGVVTEPVDGWGAFCEGSERCAITTGPLELGTITSAPPLAVVPEPALLGERAEQRRRRTTERDPATVIRDLTDLTIDAPVVHEDHGVGRYRGLQTLDVAAVCTEFLTLEYAGGDKLYVPVSSLHLISRYTGGDETTAPLHRLGGDHWEKARRKAAERARDVAAELLDIYARRAARKGHGFRFASEDYAAFVASFPFEETPDQQGAIDAVIRDMRAETPMDRVVCGDVGFGKTEVAMRAAFIGVQDGKQVAVLVPTTLLAQQHFQNFRDRFADWPIRIESLSRFSTGKQGAQVLEALGQGKVDIVIGTHKLLQSSIKFKGLGLAIIDEEHRFGVRQKEQLKKLRSSVDVLTLTATPIPRTLNMALAGLRDLSIIATPPARRLAVKTFISTWNDAKIQEACLRELKRGGQIYFLHNDVASIDRIARQLEDLLPDARIRIAHGQMPERELERVMLDFYHQHFSVLVCTTIIESGIDVPNANTIIINRADKLGLAQLHQLRGRVGRSHHRAYAYLFAPPKNQMTADAAKRLDALAALEDLGVGFALASHDLEIRGAGELLGDEQSGQIHEVGFSLYNELLERAVRELRSGREPSLDMPLHHGAEVDLRLPALLPEDYLPDVHARLVLYKRIANARDARQLKDLQVEMIDRFGLLPEPTKNLFRLTELKLKAEQLGIVKVEAGPEGGALLFHERPAIDPATIIRLIQKQPTIYKFDGQQRLRFRRQLPDSDARISAIDSLLDTLSARDAA